MEYECHTVPVDKLMMNSLGIQEPLCNSCHAPDCTNPIKEKSVSIMGIIKTIRVWMVHNQIRQVVACQGYIGDAEVEISDINNDIN